MSSSFFYGSLMSTVVLLRVLCGKDVSEEERTLKLQSIVLKPGVLKGYKRSCIRGEDYPAITFTGNQQDIVRGIYCEGLTDKDIQSLDTFEGDEYERIKVQVELLNNGALMDSNAYLWIGESSLLTGEDWSFDYFIHSGKEKKWLESRCEFYQVDELHQEINMAAAAAAASE